jgi:hypothetical protein
VQVQSLRVPRASQKPNEPVGQRNAEALQPVSVFLLIHVAVTASWWARK